MEKIELKAYAKINLTLNVLDKREDGYHNLESIFQPISLCDEIIIEKINNNKIEFYCDKKEFENDDNIVVKAYYKLRTIFPNNDFGVKVYLKKKIPSEAGMRWRKYGLC